MAETFSVDLSVLFMFVQDILFIILLYSGHCPTIEVLVVTSAW